MSNTRQQDFKLFEEGLRNLLNELLEKPDSPSNQTLLENALRGEYVPLPAGMLVNDLTVAQNRDGGGYEEMIKRAKWAQYAHTRAAFPANMSFEGETNIYKLVKNGEVEKAVRFLRGKINNKANFLTAFFGPTVEAEEARLGRHVTFDELAALGGLDDPKAPASKKNNIW